MQALSPQPRNDFLDEWWSRVEASVNSPARKGINSLVILGAWTIWKHRNRGLIEGASPNLAEALFLDEAIRFISGVWPELGEFYFLLALVPDGGQ